MTKTSPRVVISIKNPLYITLYDLSCAPGYSQLYFTTVKLSVISVFGIDNIIVSFSYLYYSDDIISYAKYIV